MEEREVVGRQRETAWLVMAIVAGIMLVVVGLFSFVDGTDLNTLEGGVCTAGMVVIGVLLLFYGLVGFRPLKVTVSDSGILWSDKMGMKTFVRWEDVEAVRVVESSKPIRIGLSTLSEAGRYSATYVVGKDGSPLLAFQTPEDLDLKAYGEVDDVVCAAAEERGIKIVRRERQGIPRDSRTNRDI